MNTPSSQANEVVRRCFLLLVLGFFSACGMLATPSDNPEPHYLRRILANEGPVLLSPDNPFVDPNRLLTIESEQSDELAGFLELKGQPAALELRHRRPADYLLVLYFRSPNEMYQLREVDGHWSIRGPSAIASPSALAILGLRPSPGTILRESEHLALGEELTGDSPAKAERTSQPTVEKSTPKVSLPDNSLADRKPHTTELKDTLDDHKNESLGKKEDDSNKESVATKKSDRKNEGNGLGEDTLNNGAAVSPSDAPVRDTTIAISKPREELAIASEQPLQVQKTQAINVQQLMEQQARRHTLADKEKKKNVPAEKRSPNEVRTPILSAPQSTTTPAGSEPSPGAYPTQDLPLQGSPPPEAPTAAAEEENSVQEVAEPEESNEEKSEEASGEEEDVVHTVEFRGETLRLIAEWYTGTAENAERLARINQISNANLLTLGQQIRIPEYLVVRMESFPAEEVKEYWRRRRDEQLGR